MDNFEEKACLCALNRIFGFEPKIGLALTEHLGSAGEVFRLSGREKEQILGPYSRYKDRLTRQEVDCAGEELERLKGLDIRFTGWTEEGYPALLKECEDAPLGLYIRSRTPDTELWNPAHKISIVGTRDLSPYGKEWCIRIVKGLASSGERPLIISGLALGTDICAHKAAVNAGLPTIAVMATGAEQIYPCQHRDFAESLVHTPGCALVSDYPPGTPPLAVHFLRRNRIIAGLAEATVLVESRLKGGGMMTSRLAASYCRDVYALPGRVDDVCSQGCNHLIRSKTAEALTSVEALLEGLQMRHGVTRRKESEVEFLEKRYRGKDPGGRLPQMRALLLAIRKERGISLDDLAAVTGMDYSRVAELTALLQIDGFIDIDLFQRCSINVKNM